VSEYVYVAADPSQPGSAYAIIVDDGRDLAHMHKRLAEWAADGAVPTRVTREEGLAMLEKWQRRNPTLF
jgi:hypothetical protein